MKLDKIQHPSTFCFHEFISQFYQNLLKDSSVTAKILGLNLLNLMFVSLAKILVIEHNSKLLIII